MTVRLDGRVALVTGAGRGIGREHAILLGRLGASVVVNDFGGAPDGTGHASDAAQSVVAEIQAAGGEAVADAGDVSTWEDCEAMVQTAIERFGKLDVVVNNAGILRDAPIVRMTPEAWNAVVEIHLRGTFATAHFAARHWRERARAGEDVGGRLINTSSGSGLYANSAQGNYAAAKAGIATFTIVAGKELGRYGVTANAIAPVAVTRLSHGTVPATHTPDHVAPLVAWLASVQSADVTCQVFNVGGGHVSVAEGWHTGPAIDKEGVWAVDELDALVPDLVRRAAPLPDLMGYYPGQERSPLVPDIGTEINR